VALITFTSPQQLTKYSAEHALAFPILLDQARITYRAFGLGRGSVWRVWGWKAARRYLDIFRSEGTAGLKRPTEDTLQLGGDFVVDPDGNLSYGFCGDGPDDRPSTEDLIAAVRETER